MTQIELTLDKHKLLEDTAKNLGITDLSTGSYLATLIDGMSDISKLVVDASNKSISNMYLDTADEETLERYGANKGVPRIKTRTAITKASLAHLSITPELFVPNKDLRVILFAKGDIIQAEILSITFLDDVVFHSAMDKVYVSCEIRPTASRTVANDFLSIDSKVALPVPKRLDTLVKSITLNVEASLTMSDYEEDLSIYRSKLKLLAQSENVSSDDTLSKVIRESYSVFKHYTDKNTYPYTVYYLSPLMYYNTPLSNYTDVAELYLKHNTDNIRSYTSNFIFSLPEQVQFKMNIITPINNKLIDIMNGFVTTFLSSHILGEALIINKEYVEQYLLTAYPDFHQDIKVEFYYTNGSIDVPVEDINQLVIYKNQYPKLYEITYNEDYSNAKTLI